MRDSLFSFVRTVFLSVVFLASAARADEVVKINVSSVWPAGENLLLVKMADMALTGPASAVKPGDIQISSQNDPAYSPSRSPEWFSVHSDPVQRPPSGNYYWNSINFIIPVPSPLVTGARYTVAVGGGKLAPLDTVTGSPLTTRTPPSASVSFVWAADTVRRCPSIHVNMLGWLPDSVKEAALYLEGGCKNGADTAPFNVDFSGIKSFSVVSCQSGAAVFTGATKETVKPDGRKLRSLDFSSFKTPGQYRIFVPGMGISGDFRIDPKIYNCAFGMVFSSMWHDRQSAQLTSSYAAYMSGLSTDDTGASQAAPAGDADRSLNSAKQMMSGAMYVYYLLQPFEVCPERLMYRNSPVPEKNSDNPDILRAVKKEFDYLMFAQASAAANSGAVASADPYHDFSDAGQTPAAGPVTMWKKELCSTAALGAAFARAARTPDMARIWPDASAGWLNSAKEAWDFCMANAGPDGTPKAVNPGAVCLFKDQTTLDAYCLLAVELWLSTGDEKHIKYFNSRFNPGICVRPDFLLKKISGAACRSFVYGRRDGKNPDLLKKCSDIIVSAALKAAETEPAEAGNPAAPDISRSMDKTARFGAVCYELSLASSLVSPEIKKKMTDEIVAYADWTLGRNRDNVMWLSGLCVTPLDFVHWRLPNDKLPAVLMTLAMMADCKLQEGGKPRLQVTANGSSFETEGTIPFKVDFKSNSKAAGNKKIMGTYWHLDNGDYAFAGSFFYTYLGAGIYSVRCVTLDDDGWSEYRTIAVTADPSI